MSYEEILQTTEDGRFRVKLVADECPEEPYDDGQSPLLRIGRDPYDRARAEHIMATGRPLDADEYVEAAVARWGGPSSDRWPLVETYLRAFHGVTAIETWHSGSYWYVTYDPAAWREHVGAPAGSVDMSSYRAWCEGDVWGYVVEKRVTWHTDDPGYPDEERWEDTDESCWGFYGSDGANGKYLRETALEALAYADEPYAHMAAMHKILPGILNRWDRATVARIHDNHHAAPWAAEYDHTHPDPHAPFTTGQDAARTRLEYLRGVLRAEQISQGELIELANLAGYIEAGDTELLEAAGVPESAAYDPAKLAAWIADREA